MIKVEHLYKEIKDQTILEDITFEVARGECLALIGPNGAGKTTLMSCLLGDKFASRGQIEILGQAPSSQRLKDLVAVLPQENEVPAKLRVSELIDFFRGIYPKPLTNQEIDKLLQFSPEQKKQLASKLSGGQKRLLSFVLTLIGQPQLIFLDEPTASMDTTTRQRFWEIVQSLKMKGVTIVYSSHYIEEVEYTADRVLVLHKGRLIRDTSPHKMRLEEREKYFVLPRVHEDLVKTLSPISYVEVKGDTITFMTKQPELIWQALRQAEIDIFDIEMQNKTLLNSLFDATEKGDRK